MNEKLKDLLVASVPVFAKTSAEKIAALTLNDWNNIGGLIGSGLGIAYVIWNWRRKAKSK